MILQTRRERPALARPHGRGNEHEEGDLAPFYGHGGLAQLGERGVRNAEVGGSNPLPSTNLHIGSYVKGNSWDFQRLDFF